jgi:hypothetical protein
MKFVVYAKFNGKWVRIKEEFNSEIAARREMRRQVYLLYAEAATIEKEDK